VIAAPDGRAVVAPFENPALASGGTGDVLSGTIGSLLAQGLSPYDAARAGVYLHGLAAGKYRLRVRAETDCLIDEADIRPDLVHIHNVSGASLAPFLVCRKLGIPVVLTLHDYWMLCPNNMLLKADKSLCDPATSPAWCRDCYRRYDFWGSIPFRRQIIRWFVRDVRRFISPSQCLVNLHAQAGYDERRFRVLLGATRR
jgi:glycosyltransferase involved in cell wall biosynthesis